MAYGELDGGEGTGRVREFFIRRAPHVPIVLEAAVVSTGVVDGAPLVRGSSGGLTVLAGGGSERGGLPNLELPIRGTPTHATRCLLSRAKSEYEWLRGFEMDSREVPNFFPERIARAVLDVGKALRLLKSQGGESAWHRGSEEKYPTTSNAYEHQHHGNTLPSPLAVGDSTARVRGIAATPPPPPPSAASQQQQQLVPSSPSLHRGGNHNNYISQGITVESLKREDSLAIAAVLKALRSAPNFSTLVAECVFSRVRDAVMAKLFSKVMHGGELLRHGQALRSFCLLGRGDLYATFLEFSRGMGEGAAGGSTSPPTEKDLLDVKFTARSGALKLLRDGPWKAASATVGLDIQRVSGEEDEDGEGAGENSKDSSVISCFERVALFLENRAVRFEAPFTQSMVSSSGEEVRNNNSALGHVPAAHSRSPGACGLTSILRLWYPVTSVLPSQDFIIKAPRAPAQLTILGSTRAAQIFYISSESQGGMRPPVRDSTDDENAATPSSLSAYAFSHKLLLNAPPAASHWEGATTGGAGGLRRKVTREEDKGKSAAGAAWLTKSVSLTRGFFLRASVSLFFPQESLARLETGRDGVGGLPPFATVNSFSFVIHRDHAVALGVISSSSSGGSTCGAFGGIWNSLVLHFLVKALGGGKFRVVCSCYGPPQRTLKSLFLQEDKKTKGSSNLWDQQQTKGKAEMLPDEDAADFASLESQEGRTLLASAPILSIILPSEGLATLGSESGGGSETGSASPLYSIHPLSFSLEYSDSPSGGGGKRLLLSLLDGGAIASASSTVAAAANSRSSSSTSSQGHASMAIYRAATRTLLDIPLPPLEEVLNFSGLSAPGKGRVWAGFTAGYAFQQGGGGVGKCPGKAPNPGFCALEALDLVAHSDADDGVGGLRVAYDLPPILCTAFSSGFMSLYEDIFRFGLRAKSAALGLQEVWRCLRRGEGGGSGGGGLGATHRPPPPGPKGPRDPSRVSRLARFSALQALLLPAFQLRARLQFLVDALLYHLHVDCIGGGWRSLESALSSAKLFTEVARELEAHGRTLLSASLLVQPSVHTCLHRVLSHAERFSSLVLGGSGDSGAFLVLGGEGGRQALSDLTAAVDRDVRYLIGLLTPVDGAAGLLSRLQFNAFYLA